MSEKLSERAAMIDRALDETLRPHAIERASLRDMDTELAQAQADMEALRQYARGQCVSCGEYVQPDHRSGEEWGHTRTEAGEDRLGPYPIPVSCGPIKRSEKHTSELHSPLH